MMPSEISHVRRAKRANLCVRLASEMELCGLHAKTSFYMHHGFDLDTSEWVTDPLCISGEQR